MSSEQSASQNAWLLFSDSRADALGKVLLRLTRRLLDCQGSYWLGQELVPAMVHLLHAVSQAAREANAPISEARLHTAQRCCFSCH